MLIFTFLLCKEPKLIGHPAGIPVAATAQNKVIGFDGRHTRTHLYRSVQEGIAFTMKNHMVKMRLVFKTQCKQLINSGGGTNSDLFMQITACLACQPAVIC